MKVEKVLNGIRYTLSNQNLQVGDKAYPIARGRCLDIGNTFYLKDYFTSTNPSFEVKIIKNEWIGNKNHVFDYIKTTIKVEIPKYEDFTIEDVEETIKNKLGSFYHRWNISYDETEKVHIWLKKLERVG